MLNMAWNLRAIDAKAYGSVANEPLSRRRNFERLIPSNKKIRLLADPKGSDLHAIATAARTPFASKGAALSWITISANVPVPFPTQLSMVVTAEATMTMPGADPNHSWPTISSGVIMSRSAPQLRDIVGLRVCMTMPAADPNQPGLTISSGVIMPCSASQPRDIVGLRV